MKDSDVNDYEGGKSQNDFPSQLPCIKGLDVNEGVRRLANRWDFYERMVSRFCFENRDFIKRLKLELVAGNQETAARMLHSLKGIAGTMSASILYQTAIDAELAYKANSENFASLLLLLENQMNDLLTGVASNSYFSFR